MAHHLRPSGHALLVERLNRAPQGAPPSPLLTRILELLVDEREAALMSRLPIRPFTVREAACRWGLPEAEARKRLDWAAQQELSIDPQKFARVRGERKSSSEACSMCGEFCAMRVVGEFLGTREKADAGTC